VARASVSLENRKERRGRDISPQIFEKDLDLSIGKRVTKKEGKRREAAPFAPCRKGAG